MIDGIHSIWIKIALFVLETAALFVIYKIIDYKVNRKIKPISANYKFFEEDRQEL